MSVLVLMTPSRGAIRPVTSSASASWPAARTMATEILVAGDRVGDLDTGYVGESLSQ